MMSSDRFGKVVGVSLGLALAPSLLSVAHDSVARIEDLLDSVPDADSASDAVDRAFVRHGFLLLVVAQLEHVLKESCDDLALLCPTTLRLTDMSGHSGFEKSQKYLRKALKLNLPSDSAWSTLKSYKFARNVIAHRGRLSLDSGANGRATVRALPGIEEELENVFVLDRSFCGHLLSFAKSFLDELHQGAERLSDAARRAPRG